MISYVSNSKLFHKFCQKQFLILEPEEVQCEEIEILEIEFNNFHIHKKVKKIAGCNKVKAASNMIKDTNGRITEVGHKLERWKAYTCRNWSMMKNLQNKS